MAVTVSCLLCRQAIATFNHMYIRESYLKVVCHIVIVRNYLLYVGLNNIASLYVAFRLILVKSTGYLSVILELRKKYLKNFRAFLDTDLRLFFSLSFTFVLMGLLHKR